MPAKRPSPPGTSSAPRVVVGLRNPGADYDGTRHNLGFEVLDRLLRRRDLALARAPSRVGALVAVDGSGDERCLFAASTTYMNETGRVVRSLLAYYKVSPSDLLVLHDDIDLAFGRLRVQVGRGSGGHNGVRSIEKALGTQEFNRLKIGVGRPPGSQDPADFVLRPFTKKERPEVDLIVEEAADVVDLWLDDRARAQELAAHRGRDD